MFNQSLAKRIILIGTCWSRARKRCLCSRNRESLILIRWMSNLRQTYGSMSSIYNSKTRIWILHAGQLMNSKTGWGYFRYFSKWKISGSVWLVLTPLFSRSSILRGNRYKMKLFRSTKQNCNASKTLRSIKYPRIKISWPRGSCQ